MRWISFCDGTVRSGSSFRCRTTFPIRKTRERELAALFAAGAKLNCADLLLITDYENGEEKRGERTVRIVDIVTWLLEVPKEQGSVPLGLKGRDGK